MVGTLQKDKLFLSEVRRFPNEPSYEKQTVHWNVPLLYQNTMEALREVGGYEETIRSVSCSSWTGDYFVFGSDITLLTPTSRPPEAQVAKTMEEFFKRIPAETLYEQTGVIPVSTNMLFQLAAELPKRFKRAEYLMPIADSFNFLLSGVPAVEWSLASGTQLFNPTENTWISTLIDELKLPPKLAGKVFPKLVPAGTKLGPLSAPIARETNLEDVEVVAACSHRLAAALAGLPADNREHWAFLVPGSTAIMGTELRGPIISEMGRSLGFSNERGAYGNVRFSKRTVGDWIISECQRYWKEHDRELDGEVITHLAISAEPFEALINPSDPQFSEPGDMPLKIQAYCKETGQNIPRKPGAILRCVLESIALQYRKNLAEIEYLTGREIRRVYLLGGSKVDLLANFTANALQVPVSIVPPDIAAFGSVLVQAVTMGQIESFDRARELACHSLKLDTIIPHPAIWTGSYERFTELAAAA